MLDLQRAALQFAHGRARGDGEKRQWNTPGLGLVCATWLGRRLDKQEQCSDWDRRPLSASQVAYAAADAAVLIEIAMAMGIVA